MSADNGIYVLKSPVRDSPDRFEWRVQECQNSEEFTIDVVCNIPVWNLHYIWSRFSKAAIHHTEEDALKFATTLYQECPVCEYGIVPVTMDRTFPTLKEVYWFAVDQLSHTFNTIGVYNDPEKPATQYQLYMLRFAILDVLSLVGQVFEEKL